MLGVDFEIFSHCIRLPEGIVKPVLFEVFGEKKKC